MFTFLFSVIGLVLLQTCKSENEHFTQEWAVEVPAGEEEARQLAKDYGFEYMGKVFFLLI